jgi:tetratricopeptide (TPR) repeat protein
LLTEEAIKEIETLVKDFQFEKAETLLAPAIKQAYSFDNKLAQVKLLYLQGRIFSEKSNPTKAIAILNQAIAIAKQLNNPNLLLGPVITLANIYHVTDQNVAAAEQAQRCLTLAQQTKNLPYQVASLQSLAINGFFAHQAILAEPLLEQSIGLAQQQNDFYTMAHGYAYLGIIKTELHKFDLATEQFKKALSLISFIEAPQKRAYLELVINGYYARSQALAGNTKLAIGLYQSAIAKINTAGVRQYLALSQLNYGLAQCLRAQNQTIEAEKTLVKAELFEEEAYKHCETANLAMSFALVRQVVRRCK